MSKKKYLNIINICIVILIFSKISAQITTEKVMFEVKTSSPGGEYAPENIGAIWVEDSSDNFIKTLKIWANERKEYLYKWKDASNENVVDAITKATQVTHKTHQVSWDATDVNGDPVPNGQYNINIEITDQNYSGPKKEYLFPVGEPADTLKFGDTDYFHNVNVWWESTTSIANSQTTLTHYRLFQNYPNPFNPTTTIKYGLPEKSDVKISIYNIYGRKVKTLTNTNQQAGYHQIKWNASDIATGIYFYRINADDFIDTKKCLLIK